MKIKGFTELAIIAKDTREIEKKDKSGTYEQSTLVYRQDNEIGTIPVTREIFNQTIEGQNNTFETQYFSGVIDGRGFNSFKIIGVMPFPKKNNKSAESEKDAELPFPKK